MWQAKALMLKDRIRALEGPKAHQAHEDAHLTAQAPEPAPQHGPLWDSLGLAGPEHWLVAFPRAGHYAFDDRCRPGSGGCAPDDLPQEQAHALIDRWATAFLRRHVALDARRA